MLDLTKHAAKNSKNVCGEGPSKIYFQNILIEIKVFNKDRHTAKSISFKNICNTHIM